MHASPPLGKRTWTAEEENYLRESWGTVAPLLRCRQDIGDAVPDLHRLGVHIGVGVLL